MKNATYYITIIISTLRLRNAIQVQHESSMWSCVASLYLHEKSNTCYLALFICCFTAWTNSSALAQCVKLSFTDFSSGEEQHLIIQISNRLWVHQWVRRSYLRPTLRSTATVVGMLAVEQHPVSTLLFCTDIPLMSSKSI